MDQQHHHPLRSSLYADNDTIISGVTEVTGVTRGFRSSRYWGGSGRFDTIAEEEYYYDEVENDQPPQPQPADEPSYADEPTNVSYSYNDGYSSYSPNYNNTNNSNLSSSMTSSHYWLQRQRGEYDNDTATQYTDYNNSIANNNMSSTYNDQQQQHQFGGGAQHSVYSANTLPTGGETHEDHYNDNNNDDETYDNTRLPTHAPKNSSTQELNVVHYQDTNDILDADEVTPIPEEYYCDEYGNRYHPKKNELTDGALEPTPMSMTRRASLEMLDSNQYYDDEYNSPFSKRRKWYTITTILAAVTLALLGLSLSITSLKSSRKYDLDPINGSNYSPYNYYNYGGGGGYYNGGNNVYLPGGQSGGIIGGQLRRQQSLLYGSSSAPPPPMFNNMEKMHLHNDGTYTINHDSKVYDQQQNMYAPLSSSSASGGGLGVNDNDVGSRVRDNWYSPTSTGSDHHQQVITSNVLTTTPLTSYTPPQDYDINDPITVNNVPQNIDLAYVELSILPYNPVTEIPTVFSIPYGIKELDQDMDIIKVVLGTCYKLVQCSNEGEEILSREYEQELQEQEQQQLELASSEVEGEGVERQEDGARRRRKRRMLMELVPNDAHLRSSTLAHEETADQIVAIAEEEEEASAISIPPSFNQPIRTEMVDTSTYVNVDCTQPQGIDRAISNELLPSSMVDVIHSSNLDDTSRLFLSTMQNQDKKHDKDGADVTYHGRPVVIIRNPLDRSIAKYEWMRVRNDNVQKMTLEEFAKSDYLENNILTRTILSKSQHDTLTEEYDLVTAKKILKHKFIIGLFDTMEDSLKRFETFFGWNNLVGVDVYRCQRAKIDSLLGRYYNVNAKQIPSDDSAATQMVMEALMDKNRLDMLLYDYVKFLYDYQGAALFGIAPPTADKTSPLSE